MQLDNIIWKVYLKPDYTYQGAYCTMVLKIATIHEKRQRRILMITLEFS